MASFSDLLQQGTAQAWLYVPSAVLLGALHGLEPGHSKTMMAALIVAVRGTVAQAVLLGLAATVSHTFVVWVVALGGMYLWQGRDPEHFKPYFQLASAAIIILIALWMLRRTWLDQHRARAIAKQHDHRHHPHDHSHDIADRQSAHERAHADDIRLNFADGTVTTGQIVMFGLTGGLIPCPAAITVLLLCLQLKQLALGAVLVLCFSIGLAITMVTVGVAAAIGVRHATTRFSWLSTVSRRAPYVASLLIIAVGIYVGINGWMGLSGLHSLAGG